jgi:predicted nucleic acid-binding protein
VILADTSVWVDHLRRGNARFPELLRARAIVCHPFVIGELALGYLNPRESILQDLQDLPRCVIASDDEVLHLIGRHGLHGRGIGYVDAHLLAAVRITAGSALWTFDKRLHSVAVELGSAMKASE